MTPIRVWTRLGIDWPSCLCLLSTGGFNQSLQNVCLPSGLHSLILGDHLDRSGGFNQSLQNVCLPCGLRTLNLGIRFDQCLDGVRLPDDLETLNFGDWDDKPRKRRLLSSQSVSGFSG